MVNYKEFRGKHLTKKETDELLADGTLKSRDKVIMSNIGMIISLADMFIKSAYKKKIYIRYDDLIQSGILGLFEAVKKYDPTKGCKFNTYAYYWVKMEMHNLIKNENKEMGRCISIDEAKEKNRNRAEIECKPVEYREFDYKECLKCCNEKERYIVEQYYYYGKKLREIADEIGCTRQYVSLIKIKAFKKIVNYIVKNKIGVGYKGGKK